MRRVTIIIIMSWIACAVIYYGLGLNAAAMPVSLYMSNAIYGFMEILSVPFALKLMETPFIGRVKTIGWGCILSGLCIFVSLILVEFNYCEKNDADALENKAILAALLLSFTGKFFISISFGVVYNITAELFPTEVRAIATGFCSS